MRFPLNPTRELSWGPANNDCALGKQFELFRFRYCTVCLMTPSVAAALVISSRRRSIHSTNVSTSIRVPTFEYVERCTNAFTGAALQATSTIHSSPAKDLQL